MALTPNIMMASEGLIENTALQRVGITNDYSQQVIVTDYADTVDVYELGEGAGFITQALVDDFISRLDGTAPYISNRVESVPAGSFVIGTRYTIIRSGDTDFTLIGAADSLPGTAFTATGVGTGTGTASIIESTNSTTIINQHAINLFPNAPSTTSNQQFVLYALIAMGQVELSNKYINAAKNAETLSAQTYTSQDALITGNIAAISTSPAAWGEELAATGVLFDFAKLDNIGTPQAIIEALMDANMLGMISDELTTEGLDVTVLARSIRNNPGLVLKPPVQKRCYDAFKLVAGNKLTSILDVMKFRTSGITSLDQLLDLRKIFPTTFATITAPRDGTLRNIFTSAGNLTGYFSDVVAPLQSVIPATIAKSNSAFICSLRQINGILNTNSESLGATASCVETNSGLPHTDGLTVALPQSTIDAILESMGGGTGPDGTWYLTDFVGAPAGAPYNTNMAVITNHMSAIQAAGGYDDIAEILLVMRDVLGGVDTARVEFTVISNANPPPDDFNIEIFAGNPGAGFYTNPDDYDFAEPINALLTELDLAVAAYIAAYPTQHAAMLEAHSSSSTSVVAAIKQLWDANIRFNTTYVVGYQTSETTNEPGASVDPDVNGLPPSKSSTLLFAENLHQYGNKPDKYNIAEILELMATNTLGGNAIIAAMREGRNLDKLFDAGIRGDNQISEKPSTVEPGNIS